MWYPREDRAEQKLILSCKNCTYEEEAEEPKTYENKLKKEITCVRFIWFRFGRERDLQHESRTIVGILPPTPPPPPPPPPARPGSTAG